MAHTLLLISSMTFGLPNCCVSTDEAQRNLNKLLLILICFTECISNTSPVSLPAVLSSLKRVSQMLFIV